MSILCAIIDVKTVKENEKVAKPKTLSIEKITKDNIKAIILSGISFAKDDERSNIPTDSMLFIESFKTDSITVKSINGELFTIAHKDLYYCYRADEYLAYFQAYHAHRMYMKDEAINTLKIEKKVLITTIKEIKSPVQ